MTLTRDFCGERIKTPDNTPPCKVFIDGKEVTQVYECRIGSNGWVKRYKLPLRLNKNKDAIVMMPILRGNVQVTLL